MDDFKFKFKLTPPSLRQIIQQDSKWAAVETRKVSSFWFQNSLGDGRDVQKVAFVSDPASQNATWRQNVFTYRKKETFDFGRTTSLTYAENGAKICQKTAQILWCI